MALVIGLNSGSSFDGIDAVLVDIEADVDGYPRRPTFIDGLSHDWPDDIASRVRRAFANDLDIFSLTRLNYEAGAVYADAARTLLEHTGVSASDVTVIGFDGQTIYQEPPNRAVPVPSTHDTFVHLWSSGAYPVGLQIGEPSVVASLINIPVVSQFRPVDHALGGTGAPLMQFLDFCAFRDVGPVLTLNIGGIANCHLAQADRSGMIAFDTGPGNVMIDHAMSHFFGMAYDADGGVAATGTVDDALLSELLRHPYFARPIPRSAWRLDFGGDFADQSIAAHPELAPADVVATFTAFTAHAIVRSITDNVAALDSVEEIICSGGGTRNGTLMGMLTALLEPRGVSVVVSDVYGIPSQFKEAIKFAALAFANVNSMANNIPAACGASAYSVMGKFVHAPRDARV